MALMQSNPPHLKNDTSLLDARFELRLTLVARGLHTVIGPAMLDLEPVARM